MAPLEDDPLDDELISSIADGTCVLFLGAGFTNAFSKVGGENVKTASELGEKIVRSLIDRLAGSEQRSERVVTATTSLYDDGTMSYQLRLAAQFYISELVRYEEIDPSMAREGLIELLVQETGQVFGKGTTAAAAPLLALPWSSIYTTNYDSLVEATLSTCGIRYQVTSRPSDLVERAGDRLEVVKIHGSIDEVHLDKELPLVVTADDYASFGWTRGLLLDELRVNLAQRDILFLGYGLQDENLDAVIREVSRAISRTPRSLYVFTRGTAEEPWWNYLRLRKFKVRRSQDLVRLAGRLTDALSDFRTSHDAGYVEYAVTSRDHLDRPYDSGDLMKVTASVARQTWQSSRTFESSVDLARCGDDLVASLYFYLRAKSVENVPEGNRMAHRLRAGALREWLTQFARGEPPSRTNWHRALECLALAAQDFDDDHVRRVVGLLRTNSQQHADPLSRWLTLQLVRESQMKTAPKAVAPVNAYIVSDARTWREDVNTDAASMYRPVVPRLAWSLFRTGEYEEFLEPRDLTNWGDLLLTWELSKVSGQSIQVPKDPARVTHLGDGVRLDSEVVHRLLGLGAGPSAATLVANPLVRRASLRAEFDRARAAEDGRRGCGATAAVLEFIDSELAECDRGVATIEPFFGSFVLLEQLSTLSSEADCDLDHLAIAHRQLMTAGLDAVDRLNSGDPRDGVGLSRASHFATAMCRDLLYGARTLEQRHGMTPEGADLFEELTSKVAVLSASHQWMVENLLNVSVHLARLPDSTPLVQHLLDRILAEVRQDDVWESLSPLLRYYVTKSSPGKGWRSRG